MTKGFTLIELVVAALLLEIGMVGVMGLLLLAHRAAAEARRWEEATATAAWVADSLAFAGAASGEARRAEPWGTLRWRVGGDGGLVVEAVGTEGELLIAVPGRVWEVLP